MAVTQATQGLEAPIPGDAALRQFTGYAMKRACLMVQDAVADALAPLGLRIGTFSALGVVAGSPGISQSQLSDVLRIRRSGIVVVVDELQGAGLLERCPVPGDRRTYALTVTPEGEGRWREAEAAVRAREADILGRLAEDEIATLQDLLARAERSAARGRGGKK
ncbi:MarR family winged helix-turn-helix transcriptional regulator [Sulfitobacter sp. LCG007]